MSEDLREELQKSMQEIEELRRKIEKCEEEKAIVVEINENLEEKIIKLQNKLKNLILMDDFSLFKNNDYRCFKTRGLKIGHC